MSQTTENTNEKGQRNEREAKDILSAYYGAGVEKVDAFTNHDPFGFVDLIAMQPGERVRFVQVKTNSFTAADRRKYQQKTRKLPPEHAEFEVWVRVDYEGWRMYEYDGESFEQYLSLPADTSTARERYRSVAKGRVSEKADESGEEAPNVGDQDGDQDEPASA